MSAVLAPPSDPVVNNWIGITEHELPTNAAVAWATTASAGAVVTFLGVVRDHADGRDGVRGMTYEAYEEPALTAMRDVASAARVRWPTIDRVALLHRVGDLQLSETSVAIVVSSPHRAAAFDAARFCIDTLKETVPIWKQEHWEGGSDWAVEQHSIRRVESA
jgi:molybdopterin synthase catalytic subunit